jgi:hypothetical protein
MTVLGLALLFDPLGSVRHWGQCDGGPNCEEEEHLKQIQRSRALWQRRFAWAFCWMRPDEHSHTAFHDVASKSRTSDFKLVIAKSKIIKYVNYFRSLQCTLP